MPADLATLDALFAAATPGEWRCSRPDMLSYSIVINPATGEPEAGEQISYLYPYPSADPRRVEFKGDRCVEDAALIAALHNAWPSLRRRLEIGDAAVEVVDAEAARATARESALAGLDGIDESNDSEIEARKDRLWELGMALDAARSRLRALREVPDAA